MLSNLFDFSSNNKDKIRSSEILKNTNEKLNLNLNRIKKRELINLLLTEVDYELLEDYIERLSENDITDYKGKQFVG